MIIKYGFPHMASKKWSFHRVGEELVSSPFSVRSHPPGRARPDKTQIKMELPKSFQDFLGCPS